MVEKRFPELDVSLLRITARQGMKCHLSATGPSRSAYEHAI
jgi:hypothetical protein